MDALKQALDKRHPDYTDHNALWTYYADHYVGGVLWPGKANPLPTVNIPTTPQNPGVAPTFQGTGRYLWQFPMESADKYRHRLARAVYVNIIAPVVDFYAATVGKSENVIYTADPNFEEFEDDADLQGQAFLTFMQTVRTNAAVRGHSYVLIDSTRAGQEIITQRDALEAGIRPYVTEIAAEDLLNWRMDAAGKPTEILFRVKCDPDGSLLDATSSASCRYEYRYWTRNEWRVYDVDGADKVILREQGAHSLGEIPIVPLYHRRTRPMLGDSLLKDAAKIAHLLSNWLSGLDEAMESQMFAVPIWKSRKSPTEAGVGSAVLLHLNPEEGEDFSYVAPETAPFEAGWSAFYRMIQLANKFMGIAPKTITAEGSGNDPQSGVSKEWDFVETEKVLARMAANEQDAVEQIFYFVGKWMGIEWKGSIQYATKYDLSTAADDIADLISLQSAGLPATARQELMRRIVTKKMPSLPEPKVAAINKEIDTMEPYVDPAVEAAAMTMDQAKNGEPSAMGNQGGAAK